jgi:hypothetical protein
LQKEGVLPQPKISLSMLPTLCQTPLHLIRVPLLIGARILAIAAIVAVLSATLRTGPVPVLVAKPEAQSCEVATTNHVLLIVFPSEAEAKSFNEDAQRKIRACHRSKNSTPQSGQGCSIFTSSSALPCRNQPGGLWPPDRIGGVYIALPFCLLRLR